MPQIFSSGRSESPRCGSSRCRTAPAGDPRASTVPSEWGEQRGGGGARQPASSFAGLLAPAAWHRLPHLEPRQRQLPLLLKRDGVPPAGWNRRGGSGGWNRRGGRGCSERRQAAAAGSPARAGRAPRACATCAPPHKRGSLSPDTPGSRHEELSRHERLHALPLRVAVMLEQQLQLVLHSRRGGQRQARHLAGGLAGSQLLAQGRHPAAGRGLHYATVVSTHRAARGKCSRAPAHRADGAPLGGGRERRRARRWAPACRWGLQVHAVGSKQSLSAVNEESSKIGVAWHVEPARERASRGRADRLPLAVAP